LSDTESNEDALAPGTVFGSYEILRLIGTGNFGVVYEAVRHDTKQHVALKVLQLEVQGNEEIVRRFVREAKAVALFKHPNVVSAVDVGEEDGRPFLAMELLKGEPLGDLMKREGKLELKSALDIVIPLMAAVRTVHAQGIVHRDLKPDNVFITYPEPGVVVPKILDFGFAKMAEPGLQLTGKDTAIGTPNFMSPEQMLSPRSVDPRSDQWALGVILYFILTGTKPFAGKVLAETLRNVLQHTPTPIRQLLPTLPEAVETALARSMQKPPDQRFASVHDFAQVLMPFATPETTLLYAREFYTVAVWDALGEDPSADARMSGTRRSRAARAAAASSSRPSMSSTRPTNHPKPAARTDPSSASMSSASLASSSMSSTSLASKIPQAPVLARPPSDVSTSSRPVTPPEDIAELDLVVYQQPSIPMPVVVSALVVLLTGLGLLLFLAFR
jgi:eukaryotic-like serine/threonine-protein kinase